MKTYLSIGCMSGTSLDGLDLVACKLSFDSSWKFELLKAVTIPYSHKWVSKLSNAAELTKSKDLKIA